MMDIPPKIWKSGNLLVMHVNAKLPDFCVKTNKPAYGKRLNKTLYWHSPILYWLILLNIFIYAIVACFVRKKVTVEIGISDEVLKKRKSAIISAWVLCLSGFTLFFAGLALSEVSILLGLISPIGVIIFLFGLYLGFVKASIISLARISTDHIWLKGVNKDLIAQYPEWNTRVD